MSTMISAFQSFLNPYAQIDRTAELNGAGIEESSAAALNNPGESSFQPSPELAEQKLASSSAPGSKDSSLSGDDLQGYLAFQSALVKNFQGVENKGF